jgi:ribosomal-protein-alanine N-acetyltransferase
MQEADIPAVLSIEHVSFGMPWSKNSFLSELYKSRSLAIVAEREGALAGYICAERILDEGHILTLAVRREDRRLGIAKLLVGFVLAEFRNRCHSLYLEVRTSNLAALRLYEGLGFKVVGTRKRYYASPEEDATVMRLALLPGDRP